MITRSRVAAMLAVSTLCVGLAATPAVFAAEAGHTTKAASTVHKHKHKASKKHNVASTADTPEASVTK